MTRETPTTTLIELDNTKEKFELPLALTLTLFKATVVGVH
jgi:hypothetical protein